ncbi:uncharacterized protein LOC123559790 [Mercenaria mercenaria]|uniref:uncharacterized protein LOC123559790 n=1 Tax=Mercenaria mercenaria TaxID=6596 RepID=UPI00234FB4C3|nr:uncharacterized protein LOC123559790 [Mercenaria mercenaria]
MDSEQAESHEVVEEEDVEENTTAPTDICDPCNLAKKQVQAAYFCEECEERLCENCFTDHKTRKATKLHDPVGTIPKLSTNIKLCEPCEMGGRSNTAANFCEDCDEYLCEECTQVHQVRKATKSHALIPASIIKERACQSDEVQKYCEPCESFGKNKEATKYCAECDELLCDACTETHSMSKITKTHVPIPVAKMLDLDEANQAKLCEPCQNLNLSANASKYCEECNELLCDACLKVHKFQNSTKSHNPKELSEKTVQNCDICLQRSTLEPAILYCESCNEALCQPCSERHRKQKATKHHTLGGLRDRNKTFLCDPCSSIGESNKATECCIECNEFLCIFCSKRHRLQKATKEHSLTFPDADLNRRRKPTCFPCKENGMVKTAEHFCKNCDENLCMNCAVMHRNQNATRNHEILAAEDTQMTDNYENCSQCKDNGITVIAAQYCEQCEEYYCCNCRDMHKRSAASRSHELVDITLSKDTEVSCDSCKLAENVHKVAEMFCCECKEHLCNNCCSHHMLAKVSKDHKLITVAESVKHSKSTSKLKQDKSIPGKPFASDIRADSLTLSWEPPACFEETHYYQISYKDVDTGGKWKFHAGEHYKTTAILTDLKSNTKFIFRVRVVYEDGEGAYSPISDEYITSNSPASRIIEFARIVEKGEPSPSKHALPIVETRDARNAVAKTKKFEIGSPPMTVDKEKTIMLVGATGTGKSTLVDGIVNYVLGVSWSDPFRFTVIDLEQEEKDKLRNQAVSQTEWITCYSINPEKGSRLPYRLNIIDTPGFGDTRGITRDQEIVEQIRQLFSESGSKGVSCIELVCFLIKAPDARLTAVQRYIFQSVMSLFGKDIEQNICTMVTFADGIDPPALAALKESELPFGESFTFNNSGLFAKNVDISSSSLSPMFWDMGLKSFREFFRHLDQVQTRSLQLTKNVLDERSRMEATVQNLQPQLDAGLSKVDQLKQEIKIFEDNKSFIKDNANFEYEVEQTQHRKIELPLGEHVTNCTYCNFTCHPKCALANDDEKIKCSSMDREGNCRICPEKCFWKKHANTPYRFEYEQVKVKKKYAEMQQKYKEATGKLPNQEQLLEKMGSELDDLCYDIEDMMVVLKECNERLKEIALRPNPLTVTEHIDQMIENEKLEKKSGFSKRVSVLQQFRKRAQIGTDAEIFHKEARTTLGAVGRGRQRPRTRNTRTLMTRMKGWITNPFSKS